MTNDVPQLLPSVYSASTLTGRCRQGQIIAGISEARIRVESTEAEPSVRFVKHPYALIVTQDCDLQWDHSARIQVPDEEVERLITEPALTADDRRLLNKLLRNILFLEAVDENVLRPRLPLGSDLWRRIKRNQDERYHFLRRVLPDEDSESKGIPALVLDFKRYFTIPTEDAYRQVRSGNAKARSELVTPYLEHLSARFGYYQSRVGLPQEHHDLDESVPQLS